MKAMVLMVCLALVGHTTLAAEAHFEQAGFSIKLLDTSSASQNFQPLQMFLPAVNGFAANVNVQLQFYSDSLQAYQALSESQFKQFGMTLVRSELKQNVLWFEYRGAMYGNDLYFYSKALKRGDSVYLATATDLQSQWPQSGEQLRAVVDSMTLPAAP